MMNRLNSPLPVVIISVLFFCIGQLSNAQSIQIEEAYKRAEEMLSWKLADKVFYDRVEPVAIDANRLWYRVNTPGGYRYFIADISEKSRFPAFDHQRLASAMESQSGQAIQAENLGLQGLKFSDDLTEITFYVNRALWKCSTEDYLCEITGQRVEQAPFSVISPNGQKAVYTKDHNLWVQDLESDEHRQLTFDGEEFYSYGRDNHGWRRSDRPIVKWSPDSKKLTTFRLDERGVGKMTLWRTQTDRPEADIWPYALPGDSIVPMLERIVIDTEETAVIFLESERDHQRASNCCGLIRNGEWTDNEWSRDGGKLAFVSTSRDYKGVTLRLADPVSGSVRDIYHEHDDIFFESNLTSRGAPNWRVLHDSNEFIWFTRKDNWGHLYLHNSQTGELKNRITQGNWNVIDVLHVDEKQRRIYFTGMGRESDRDPYFEHFYSVNFDGSGLKLLTPESANHSVSLMDTDGGWFVDTYSMFTSPQITVVRSFDGDLLMELEQADISELLNAGWKKPVPFSVLARDGETELYGLMMRPSDFDKNKKYPIINAIYPGPQGGSLGARNFSVSQRGQAQALAELGFVVVAIDALGSSPMRSRDFHTYYYGDMSDNGLPDQIAGMKQLAEHHSFIDIERAGIYGHSGGGYATAAALLQYPDFFKVGVSGAGNHDNRGYTYYWGEKYQGLLKETESGDSYNNQANHLRAENLTGKLLLSYGTMDTNVHPSMTLLLINELIRHNKDFDLVVMPNRGHGYSQEPYNIRKTWDYFVRHLAGMEPPKEYQISR